MTKEETFKYYEGQLLSSVDVINLRKVFKAFDQQTKELTEEVNTLERANESLKEQCNKTLKVQEELTEEVEGFKLEIKMEESISKLKSETIEKQRKEIEYVKKRGIEKVEIGKQMSSERLQLDKEITQLKAEAKEKDERMKHILDNYSIEYVVKSKLKELLNQ